MTIFLLVAINHFLMFASAIRSSLHDFKEGYDFEEGYDNNRGQENATSWQGGSPPFCETVDGQPITPETTTDFDICFANKGFGMPYDLFQQVQTDFREEEELRAFEAVGLSAASGAAVPFALWVLGPSAAGKSTLISNLQPSGFIDTRNYVVVDGDALRDLHPGFSALVANGKAQNCIWKCGFDLNKRITNKMKDKIMKQAVDQKMNLVLPHTHPESKISQKLAAGGYAVSVISVYGNKAEIIDRGLSRSLESGKRYNGYAAFQKSLDSFAQTLQFCTGKFDFVCSTCGAAEAKKEGCSGMCPKIGFDPAQAEQIYRQCVDLDIVFGGRRNHNLFTLVTLEPAVTTPLIGDTSVHMTLDMFKEQEGARFAKMKMGNSESLDYYAEQLAGKIVATFPSIADQPSKFALVKPASIDLPTAATLIEERLKTLLGSNVQEIVVERNSHLEGDFAKMTEQQRAHALSGSFSLRANSGIDYSSTTFIMIEDTVVTGAHYIETQKILQRSGVPIERVNLVAIASLVGLKATVEGALNEEYYSPTDPEIPIKLIESLHAVTQGRCPTSRQVKFILSSLPEAAFSKFQALLGESIPQFQGWFLLCAELDDFQKLYSKRFCELAVDANFKHNTVDCEVGLGSH